MTNIEKRVTALEVLFENYKGHEQTSPETDRRLTIVETEQKNKVGFKQFYWVIGIMMTILMTTVGYLIDQIHDVQANQYEVAREVSKISGTLNNITFE